MEAKNESSNFLIPIAIVAAGALVAGAIFFGGAKGPSSVVNRPTADTKLEIAPITSEDHILGSLNADIVIVEYSDTECPFCKEFHYTMKEVLRSYSGKVSWIYRQLPIPQLHALAMKEAEATECAAELGGNQAFWKYLDTIFDKTNSNDSLDPAELPKIAVAVGLSDAAFKECLSSGRHNETVKADIADAAKAGASGTPYSVMVVKGGLSLNKARAIEAIGQELMTSFRLQESPVIVSEDKQRVAVSGNMPLDKVNEIIDAILK